MKNKKISQRKLSQILGIHENSVRKKLSGTTEWTISEIDKLCDYFKKRTSLGYLILFHSILLDQQFDYLL